MKIQYPEIEKHEIVESNEKGFYLMNGCPNHCHVDILIDRHSNEKKKLHRCNLEYGCEICQTEPPICHQCGSSGSFNQAGGTTFLCGHR